MGSRRGGGKRPPLTAAIVLLPCIENDCYSVKRLLVGVWGRSPQKLNGFTLQKVIFDDLRQFLVGKNFFARPVWEAIAPHRPHGSATEGWFLGRGTSIILSGFGAKPRKLARFS